MHSIGAQKSKYRVPRRLVKSIQTGEVVIAANATSGTATINPVYVPCSILIYGGFYSANASAFDASKQYPSIALTNPTTITAQTAVADASNARTVRYTIIEFQPWAIKSIQSGSIILNSVTSNTAIINAVDPNNAFVLFQGQTHSTNTALFNYPQGRLTLTNGTTVTAEKDSASVNALTVGYSVVEFNPGIIKSIQKTSATIAASSASATSTITTVDTSNSLLIYNGWHTSTFGDGNTTYIPTFDLTNSTTVTYTRVGTVFITTPCRATVVEFYPGFIRQKQKGTTVIGNGASSNTTTITASDPLKTFVAWDCFNNSTDKSSSPAATYPTIAQTSPTVITATRGGSDTNTATVAWEAIEFR